MSTSAAEVARAEAPAAGLARALPAQVGLAVAAVGVLVVVALVMRFVTLGERAIHHDESLHALFSYRFAEGKGYQHDPLMHGPLQFHFVALSQKILGADDATTRVPAAVFGAMLVATPLLMRRHFGTAGVVFAALGLAFSPSLLYYTRFAREDPYVLVATAVLAFSIWRYREEGGMRWLVAIAIAIAAEFATKETAYLFMAVFLLYVNGALTGVLLDRLGVEGGARVARGLLLFPVAWLVAATWPMSGERFGGGERPREVDLMVVLGTLTLPFLAAAFQLPLHLVGIELEGQSERVVGGLLVSAMIVASGEIGVWWDWRRWAVLAAVMYGITILLFTTFFTNPVGFAGAFWTQLDYWLAQQAVQRGEQPLYYYAFMVPQYEAMALVPAVIGGAVLLRRGHRLPKLLVWWVTGTFIALSMAGEKMPWLTVHLALPLAILAGYALGKGFEAARAGGGNLLRPRLIPVALGMALLFVYAVRTGTAVSYAHPDTPIEPLIYTQTSADIPAIARQLEALAAERGGKDRLTIIVDSSESMSWPWAWYLRDFPNTSYVERIDEETLPPGAILLLWDGTLRGHAALRDRAVTIEEYRHRWWFPEEGYRSWTPRNLVGRAADGSLFGDLVSFIANRESAEYLGTLEGVALFPEDPPALTMPTTGVSYGR